MNARDVLSNIKLVLRDPSKVGNGLNRFFHRRAYTQKCNPAGTNIFEENWDNLVLLDACRFDYFLRHSDLPGNTDFRYSKGSMTEEFIRANFAGQQLYDTVYVSANGWYERLRDEIGSDIFRFVPVEHDAVDGLTARPETVSRKAIEMLDEHPHKRLIIHYLQPHHPYLGETATDIDYELGLYQTVRGTNLSVETLRRAYQETLEIVLGEVAQLLNHLPGRTVISADHGETIGHRMWPIPVRGFGHPPGIYIDDLVKVPWHVYENGRRIIKSADGPYMVDDRADVGEITSQLADLGYRI